MRKQGPFYLASFPHDNPQRQDLPHEVSRCLCVTLAEVFPTSLCSSTLHLHWRTPSEQQSVKILSGCVYWSLTCVRQLIPPSQAELPASTSMQGPTLRLASHIFVSGKVEFSLIDFWRRAVYIEWNAADRYHAFWRCSCLRIVDNFIAVRFWVVFRTLRLALFKKLIPRDGTQVKKGSES
jgi:hypothetical protein